MSSNNTARGIHLADPRLASDVGRAPLGILLSLIVVIGASWAPILYHAVGMGAPMFTVGRGTMIIEELREMGMSGVSAADWSFAALAVFMTFWTLMMVAMMLPGAKPMISTFATVQRRHDRHVAVPTLIFVAGYTFVWIYVGLVVYVVVHAGIDSASYFTWLESGASAPVALGVTLGVAGLYQFTPLKHVCLRYCRAPFSLMAVHWKDGRTGAFEMGIRHGLVCLGCYWALFALLAAVGTMSIAWMLVLTLVVFAEKVLPHAFLTSVAVGVGLVALALLVGTGVVEPNWLT